MTVKAALLSLAILVAAIFTGTWTSTPKDDPRVASLPYSSNISVSTSVAVIGVPGWSVSQQDAPPASLEADGLAVGAVSVRGESLGATTALDGWSMIGAGSRITAKDEAQIHNGIIPTPGSQVSVSAAVQLEHQKPELPGARHLGRLADAAHAVGSCVSAGLGLGPAVAAASRQGVVDEISTTTTALRSTCKVAVVEATAANAWSVASLAYQDHRIAILVGISDIGAVELHPAAVLGAGTKAGAGLSSPSTQRSGYVQLIDVAPTVAKILGAPVPSDVDGEPMTTPAHAPTWSQLITLAARARTSHRSTPLVITALLVLGLLGIAVAGRRRQLALRWFGAMPMACFILGAQPYRGYADIAIIAAIAGAVAWSVTTAEGIALATVASIGIDMVLGARWQIDTPLGYSALVAGRFTGIGNLAFGVLAAGALIATIRRPRWGAIAILVVAVAIDGLPFLGADIGGTLALVPAAIISFGVRGKRLALAALVTVGIAVGFAALDLARPASQRTHLGRYAQKLLDGNGGAVVERKLISAVDLIGHSPLTVLALLVALVVLVWANMTAGEAPLSRTIRALSVAGVLGFLLNDSGLASAITLVWVAVPLVSAATRPPSVSRVRRSVLD